MSINSENISYQRDLTELLILYDIHTHKTAKLNYNYYLQIIS